MNQAHPELSQLSDFALGRLESAQLDAVESHLAGCETCCDMLKQMKEDTFVGLVRGVKSPSSEDKHSISDVGEGTQSDNPSAAQPSMPLAEAATVGGGQAPASSDSATQDHLLAGAHVADIPAALAEHSRYRIVELLGTGGMGSVYRAEHRLMQRHVALKVIHPKFVQSKQAVDRFRREVQAAARLQHPNIVHAYDAEQAGDVHFLVMEYVKGTDLSKLLEERGPLPVAEACEYIRQAALGLQHAHESGMVHRDIKPQNLMLSGARSASEGSGRPSLALRAQVKILDFGLASLATEAIVDDDKTTQSATIDSQKSGLTQAGSLMGTPDYMAPEQGRDAHTADIRSDIYSLGCTLYALLTGKVPFPGGTAIDKVIAHSTLPPPAIGELRKDVPAALVKVLDTMMAKEPAERYQTPAEVARALAPLSRVGSGAAGRSRRPRPLVAAALAAIFTGIALVAGVVFYIVTDNGTIEIRTDDENIKILAEQNGKLVKILDPKSKQTWVLDTGEWTLKLGAPAHGFEIAPADPFTLKRGGHQVVTIRRVKWPDLAGQPLPRREPGWTQLFNGKDLTGWVPVVADKPGVIWHIADGSLIFKKAVPPASYLRTAKAYQNYQMQLDFRFPSDTGKDYGSLRFKSLHPISDLVQPPHYFVSAELHLNLFCSVAVDYALKPARSPSVPLAWAPLPRGEWNRLLISCQDGFWDLSINGRRVTRVPNYRPGPGFIALTAWNVETHLRDIKIKELPPTVAAPAIASKPRLRREIDNGSQIQALAYTPDGKSLIVGGDDVTVFDPANGKTLYQEKIWKEKQKGYFVSQLSVSANGKTVAVGSLRHIAVLDLANRKRLKDIPVQSSSGKTYSMALAPDASSVVYASDENMRFHDLTTDKTETVPVTQKGEIFGLRYSPCGRYLINTANGLLSILDAKTRRVIDNRLVGNMGLNDISAYNNRLVILGAKENKNMFSLFDVPDANAVYRETDLPVGIIWSLSLSADSNYLALGFYDGNVQIWDLNQKKAVASWRPEPIQPKKPFIDKDGLIEPFKTTQATVAFAPDGKTLATGVDSMIKIWDLTPESTAKTDEERIQGKWRLISGEYAGRPLTPEELLKCKLVFQDESMKLNIHVGKESMLLDGNFTLDARKEPKRLTYIIQGENKVAKGSPSQIGKAAHGIYRFDGDRLILRFTEGADRRPSEFATSAKTPDQFLLTFERQDSRSDSELLQGTWKVVTFREDGKESTPEQLATVPMTLAVAGNQARLERAIAASLVRKLFEGALQLEETLSPKRLRVVSPPENKNSLLAIYHLQGDKLSLCYFPPDRNAYPSAFMADTGSGATLLVLHRDPVVTPSVSKPRSGPDKDIIQGTWKPESAEIFGDRVPPEILEMLKPSVTFTADKVIWKADPPPAFAKALKGIGDKLPLPNDVTVLSSGLEGVYHLDPAKTPKCIDLVSLGAIKKTMLGIYSLEGNTLKLCLSFDPSRVDERPGEFGTKAGVLRGMVILKRSER